MIKTYQHEQLLPLEIWHGLTPQGPLYTLTKKNYPAALAVLLRELHEGRAKSLAGEDQLNLNQASGFKKVNFTGGAMEFMKDAFKTPMPFATQFHQRKIPVDLADLVVDWGQSTIKAFTKNAEKFYPRNLHLFPHRDPMVSMPAKEEDRKNKSLIQKKLKEIIFDFPKTKSMALALPVKITEDQIAAPSTYWGLEGDLKEMLSDLPVESITVLNDAVLAAIPLREQGQRVLTVTLGYGTGAALWKK